MDRRIASPALRDDAAARALIDSLETISKQLGLEDSVVYYDFPMFRDEQDSLLRSNTMFASPEIGLIFIRPLLGGVAATLADIVSAEESLAQVYSLAFGRLLRNSKLRTGRSELAFNLDTCIFSPSDRVAEARATESEVLYSEQALAEFVSARRSPRLTEDLWTELISTIEGAGALRREREKGLADATPGTKAAALGKIYARIASFDQDQRRAAITLVDGPQRIRGIAGSGKTVVLAMKAAHIHLVRPDAQILVTFWTKSLYDQFRYLISRFYRQFSERDPDWDRIQILHAWGGRSTGGGVYYNACVQAEERPLTLADLKRGNLRPSFSTACDALLSTNKVRQSYDYVLIDEGQDLPSSFYRLCFELTRGGVIDRNVIWAYDELQNILDVEIQSVRETFGLLENGEPRVDLVRAEDMLSDGLQPHDIVLKRSYRNPAQVLMLAHALGFGIYSAPIVQILENAKHWEDLGYLVVDGHCDAGVPVVITRPPENSPIDLTQIDGAGQPFECMQFATYREEVDWVVSEFRRFISEGLRPQDIMVVSLDDRHAKKYFADIAQLVLDSGAQVNNLSLPAFDVPNFFVEGAVTLSTVYKAKGNEAAVVFVVGLDAVALDVDEVKARNKIFAAFSRSKAWLRVTAVGSSASGLFGEMRKALDNFPSFRFIYPDPAAVRMIQRDLAERSGKLAKLQKIIEELGLSNLSEAEIAKVLRQEKKV